MLYLRNFTKVCSKPVNLHKSIKDEDLLVIYGEFKRLYIISIQDYLEYQGAYNMPKSIYIDNLIRFTYYNTDCIVYPYVMYKSQEDMIKEYNESNALFKRNYFTNDTYKLASVIVKLEKPTDTTYCMSYYINNNIIDNIYKGKKETKLYLFTELLTTQIKSDITLDNNTALKTLTLPPVDEQDYTFNVNKSILKTDIQLYEYQKRDVIWMKNIENKIEKKQNVIKYNYNLIYPLLKNKFVLLNHNIFPAWLLQETPDFMKATINITYYGGNLVSKIGLGKTLISLYNILESSLKTREQYDKFVTFSDKCNYMYKRGKKKGESCTKQITNATELYCQEHKSSIFIDKRVLMYKNLDDFKVEDFLEGNLMKTNASLIICPNQLCDQWVNEYYDKFVNDKRVILLVTRDQYSNITLGDLLFADIVVVSYQFLLNIHNNNQNNNVQSKFVQSDNLYDLLNSKELTNLHHFKWRKVFLDEAHEIKNMAKCMVLKDAISKLKSSYKWNVTGTPFANGVNGLLHLLSYNTNYNESHRNTEFMDTYEIVSSGIRKELISTLKDSSLFRCNSKESIVEEYKGNIIKEYVKKLEFTVQERNIYNSYLEGHKNKYADFLIKLCCHSELNSDTKTMIQNCKTLDEIQKTLLEFNKKKLNENRKELENVTLVLEHEEKKLLEETDEIIEEQLKAHIANVKRRQTVLSATCSSLERTYNYLRNEIDKLQEATVDHTCPICLDEIDKSALTITKCGHKFCWDCLFETFNIKYSKSDFKCPTCNGLLNANEMYLVQAQNETDVEHNELDSIIQKVKSTKIGNIVHFLKTGLDPADKVIIFSQWDEMLHKVGNILEEYKIKLVYCNGSVYQRKKAIKSFSTNPDINIIMLSSRNAASGINLTKANKIILFEPVYGSSDYRKEIEAQAIGRSDRIGQKRPIDVYRFIIKDTIEEDIIEENIDDNKMKIMTI